MCLHKKIFGVPLPIVCISQVWILLDLGWIAKKGVTALQKRCDGITVLLWNPFIMKACPIISSCTSYMIAVGCPLFWGFAQCARQFMVGPEA